MKTKATFIWFVNCLLLFSITYFLAEIILNLLIDTEPRPILITKREPVKPDFDRKPPKQKDYKIIETRDLFGVGLQAPKQTASPSTDSSGMREEPIAMAFPYKLRGTAPSGEGEGWAIFESASREQFVLSQHESFPDSEDTLIEVRRAEVIVNYNNERVRVLLDDDQKHTATMGQNEGIAQSVGSNRWVLKKEGVEDALSHLSELVKQMKLVPFSQDGEDIGFRIGWLKDNSLFDEMGLLKGDIITRVNGREVKSIEDGLFLMRNMKKARDVTVDILRNGEPTTMRYEVK